MKIDFKPRLFYDGVGNVEYFGILPAAGILTAVKDGLSVETATPTIARLGQDIGQVGNPAALTEDREIPNPGGHVIYIGSAGGASNIIALDSNNGIDIDNDTGGSLSAYWFGIDGVNTLQYQILTSDGDSWELNIAGTKGGTGLLIWNNSLFPLGEWAFNEPVQHAGIGNTIQKYLSAINPTVNLAASQGTILVDTTGGNFNLSVNPADNINGLFNIKKISADANTVTITPTSGTIQGLGAPAGTFIFNGQGENIQFQSNGTNLYIL